MSFTSKAWRASSAHQVEVVSDGPPACPGNPKTRAGCGRKPHYVLTWTTNESGLPGRGKARVQYSCLYHAHTLLSVAEESGGPVTVSPYKGV